MNSSSTESREGWEGEIGGAELGWPLEGETWSPLTSRSYSDSVCATASPEPHCPSGSCYRNLSQGGFIWIEDVCIISKLVFRLCVDDYYSQRAFGLSSCCTAHSVGCVQVCVCLYAFHSASHSLAPPPQYRALSESPRGYPEWQMSVTRRQVN